MQHTQDHELTDLLPPPGVTVMTVGEARQRWPEEDIGPALRRWGDSPAVPRDPDYFWAWVLDEGREIRSRFESREEAIRDAWQTLWCMLEQRGSSEQCREMKAAQIVYLQEQGWGFPTEPKATIRKGKESTR